MGSDAYKPPLRASLLNSRTDPLRYRCNARILSSAPRVGGQPGRRHKVRFFASRDIFELVENTCLSNTPTRPFASASSTDT